MRVFNYKLLTNGDMSGNTNSPPQQLVQMQISSIQANFTGSPVGSLKLQITNDDPNIVGSSNVVWSDYSGSSTAVSGSGNFLWNLLSNGYNFVRVVYTFISGTGSLSVTASGKGP